MDEAGTFGIYDPFGCAQDEFTICDTYGINLCSFLFPALICVLNLLLIWKNKANFYRAK
jgi:hypothetical protein